MNRELYCSRPRMVQWQHVDEAELADGQFRAEFRFGSAKHGTERMLFAGILFERGDYDFQQLRFRRNGSRDGFRAYAPGNLCVSEVTETRGCGELVKLGDHVLLRGAFREARVLDASRLGALDVRRLPGDLDWRLAVCLDPMVFALAALRDGNVRIGDVVVVVGLGALGLCAVQLAKLQQAGVVIAIDRLAARREVARTLGADLVVDPAAVTLSDFVRDHVGGRGADVAVDFSGTASGLQSAIAATHFGGCVVAASAPVAYAAGLDLGGDAHFNCLNLVFSRGVSVPNREHPRWSTERLYDTCWKLMVSGQVTAAGIVDTVIDFETLPAAYPRVLEDESTIKIGVRRAP